MVEETETLAQNTCVLDAESEDPQTVASVASKEADPTEVESLLASLDGQVEKEPKDDSSLDDLLANFDETTDVTSPKDRKDTRR